MNPLKIAVIGANGQLGKSLEDWSKKNKTSHYQLYFYSSSSVDITNKNNLDELFSISYDYIINCAAYTAVDLAETERELAKKINTEAVGNLAKHCALNQVTLIHISTDFVFDGTSNRPYKETDQPHPINIYGKTKYEGEQLVANQLNTFFILRTGWLYSKFGNNFFNTMRRLFKEKEQLKVVSDQIGTPTNTATLCRVIDQLIVKQSTVYGLYHVADEGMTSWYDFACEILKFSKDSCQLLPIPSVEFPTPAKRPAYSVLDKTKIKKELQIELPHWKENLQNMQFD